MKLLRYTRSFLYTFAITLGLASAALAIAWTGPSASPPLNNATAPLNTGGTGQIKSGSITASSLGATSVVAGTTVWSPQYCFAGGSNCITTWPTSTSQWTTSGTNIYNSNTGNVGVGTVSPTVGKLEISKLSTYNSESTAGLSINTGTVGQPELNFGSDNANTLNYIQSLSKGTSYTTVPLVLQPNGGNVFISGGLKQTGTAPVRIENTFAVGPTGGTGPGLEFGIVSGSVPLIQSYNRTTAAYSPVYMDASAINLRPNGAVMMTIAATGITTYGDVCTSTGHCLNSTSSGGTPFGGLYTWNSTLGRCDTVNGITGACSCPAAAPTVAAAGFYTYPNGSGVYYENLSMCY